MPKGKRADKKDKSADSTSAIDKIARVLGILATKEIDQKSDRVALLRSLGFEVSEIAAMLRMTENHVRVATFQGRKAKKPTHKGKR